jgi:hypothetical protein
VTSALVREVCRDFDIKVAPEPDDDLGTPAHGEPALQSESLFERTTGSGTSSTASDPAPAEAVQQSEDGSGNTVMRGLRGAVRPFSFLGR